MDVVDKAETIRRPIRRWFRFGLRTLLVLLTVFGVWLGWFVHLAREQRKSVDAIEAAGGSVQYDYQLDEDDPWRRWLRGILPVDAIHDVGFVLLCSNEISDATPLARFKDLEILYLYDARVSDLGPLAGLTELRELDVAGTNVADVSALATLTKLQELDLSDSAVADVMPLAELENPKRLNLSGTLVSETQVTALRRALPSCEIPWTPDRWGVVLPANRRDR